MLRLKNVFWWAALEGNLKQKAGIIEKQISSQPKKSLDSTLQSHIQKKTSPQTCPVGDVSPVFPTQQ